MSIDQTRVFWTHISHNHYRVEIGGRLVYVHRLGQGQWAWSMPDGKGCEQGVETDMEQVVRSVRDAIARLASRAC